MLPKFMRYLLLPLFGLLLYLPTPVHADAVDYQALTYGTSKTSMASGYYVKPADVVANGDQYLVTMTIHTGTSLGKWPVTVLSINGTGPANVTKTQSASGYDYSYAFQTADLSKTISSAISIDVPDVYVAKHNISFKFDTSHLPTLAGATATTSSSAVSSSASGKQATASSAAASSGNQTAASSSSAAASSSSQAAAASQAAASASKKVAKQQKQLNARTAKQAAQIKALNRKNQQTQTAIVIGGVAGVLILGAAAYFFVKRH